MTELAAREPDMESFLRTLARLQWGEVAEARELFEPTGPLIVTRAPGRLDVMGGIADYSGSLVLQLPIAEAAFAALQRDSEPLLRVVSLGTDMGGRSHAFCMPLARLLEPAGEPISYEEARACFASDPHHAWAAYALGAFLVLMRERGVRFPGGARILIDSKVPEGKGVSSSAAIEVAVMQAIAVAFEIAMEPRELALLCQMVENRVVGAPCGVMDQMASALGEADHLLALVCQPAEIQGQVRVPGQIRFWGIDSGVRHSVSGADYGSVRTGAFMGYRILADACGLETERAGEGRVRIRDERWNGYLANISPSEFEQDLARHVPDRMAGADFLARYGGTTDSVTTVDPGRTYAVRVPSAHPIYENFRVRAFAALLRGLADGSVDDGERMEQLGELMYQSHAGYSACGLGSDATDRLVQLARDAGPDRGIYGAKITGGGSGGTVALLASPDGARAVREIAARYCEETGRTPSLFESSSPGAAAFGALVIDR